jgi:hypothetical protein
MLEVNLNIMKMDSKWTKNYRTFYYIVLFVALMQVLDVYTYIFEIFKIYFVKNSKILVLINFSVRAKNRRKHRKNACVDKSLTMQI